MTDFPVAISQGQHRAQKAEVHAESEKKTAHLENVEAGIYRLPEGHFYSSIRHGSIYGLIPQGMITDITNIGTQIYENPGHKNTTRS